MSDSQQGAPKAKRGSARNELILRMGIVFALVLVAFVAVFHS